MYIQIILDRKTNPFVNYNANVVTIFIVLHCTMFLHTLFIIPIRVLKMFSIHDSIQDHRYSCTTLVPLPAFYQKETQCVFYHFLEKGDLITW